MPAKPDTIIYNMRFPKADEPIYYASLGLAKSRRISLAELIRQCLIKELKEAGKWAE